MNHNKASLALTVVVCSLGLEQATPSAVAQGLSDYERNTRRIVHTFNFDERDQGNLEDVPKFWEVLRPPEFPHFSYGNFDFDHGHDAPPSFRLVSEGRNVAYQYRGEETRVRVNSEYRIAGYIKPGKLRYARACLSAHFVDQYGEPIAGTLVRSRFVGGPADGEDWVHVELFLPIAPPQAHTIGLIAWVMQEPTWNTAPHPRRHISRSDVFGSALFDDITIYTLPRVELASTSVGNVLLPDESDAILVTLADNDDSGLTGRFSIRAADGGLVETQELPVSLSAGVVPTKIQVSHLDPGVYVARVDVIAQGETILSRDLQFARLAESRRKKDTLARAFGVVMDHGKRSETETELTLLRKLGVGSVKIPVWTGLDEDPETIRDRRVTDQFLHQLSTDGFALTAVFVGPPAAIVRAGGQYVRPLIDLLADEPSAWDEHLAAVAAPYASIYRSWQIGSDERDDQYTARELEVPSQQFRASMRRFITVPVLASTISPHVDARLEKLPVDHATIMLDPTVPIDRFQGLVKEQQALGYDRVSAYVPPLPRPQYRRLPELSSWIQRVIAARHAGAATVYTPQVWHVRTTSVGAITEPSEQFVALRTVADLLGNAVPGPRIPIADGVTALSFQLNDQMVLVAWDDAAPEQGRDHMVQLGHAVSQIDIWGRETPLTVTRDGRHVVRLSASPLFFRGVEPWLVELQTAIRITPTDVESGREGQRFEVDIPYHGDRPITGTVELRLPDSWEASPRSFDFSLMPQRVEQKTIDIQIPHSEGAGRKQIVAVIEPSEGGYHLEVPLTIRLGLSDIEVSGLAVMEGDVLKLRHVLTNHSNSVLSFRASATVPGRERQYRPFTNLRPGDSQVVEYRFANAGDLVGRDVRLVLRELNDGPRIHNLQLTVP